MDPLLGFVEAEGPPKRFSTLIPSDPAAPSSSSHPLTSAIQLCGRVEIESAVLVARELWESAVLGRVSIELGGAGVVGLRVVTSVYVNSESRRASIGRGGIGFGWFTVGGVGSADRKELGIGGTGGGLSTGVVSSDAGLKRPGGKDILLNAPLLGVEILVPF